MPTVVPRRQRSDRVDRRRAELLAATRRVVLQRGLSNTRVADVAAATNVSGGLIHYHFVTKESLVTAMLRDAAARDIEEVRRIARGGGSAVGRLDRILRRYIPASAADESWLLWLDSWAASLRDPAVQAICKELDDAWDDVLRHVIRDGAAAGEFRCANPAESAERLAALLDGLCVRGVLRHHRMSRRRLLAHARAGVALELGVDGTALAAAGR